MSKRQTEHQRYQEIYNAIDVPSSIPLEVSHHQYKKVHADEISRLMNNGYAYDKAFKRVVGSAPKKQKKSSNKIPLALGGIAVAVTLAAGASMAALTPASISQAVSSQQTMEDIAASTNAKTIVVAGMDTRPEKDQGDGTSKDVPGNRTDALAVVKIAPISNQVISVVSIPRDTAVDTSSCDGSYGETVKINSIFDDYGLKCLETVAGEMTGEEVTGAVAFNFNSFSTIIDSLGGVEITTETPIIDDTLGVVFPEAGIHHADGRTALNYARARKVKGTAKSDLERVDRQQEVALAVMDKVKNASTSMQVTAVKDVITKVLPNTTIDGISISEMIPLIKLASTLTPEDVALGTIDIIGEDGMGNLIYDEESAKQMFNEMKYASTSESVETQSTQGTQETHG